MGVKFDPILGALRENDATTSSAVSSVNEQTGEVVLTQDDIGDGDSYKQFSNEEKTKLSSLQEGTLTHPQVLARSLGC